MRPLSAFLIFDSQQELKRVLERVQELTIDVNLPGQEEHVNKEPRKLTVEVADHPSNIIWDSLGKGSAGCRRWGLWFIYFLMLSGWFFLSAWVAHLTASHRYRHTAPGVNCAQLLAKESAESITQKAIIEYLEQPEDGRMNYWS